jgi:hypothetical protein
MPISPRSHRATVLEVTPTSEANPAWERPIRRRSFRSSVGVTAEHYIRSVYSSGRNAVSSRVKTGKSTGRCFGDLRESMISAGSVPREVRFE